MQAVMRAAGAVAGAGVAAGLYASLIERNAFTLRRFTAPVLPSGARDIRILQVSDLHLVPGQRRKIDWVRALDRLDPDLVIDTGDNLAHLQAVPAALEMLAPLLERPGIFVMGSNDYFAPVAKNPAVYLGERHRDGLGSGVALPTEELRAGFTQAGWWDLNNTRQRITVNGSSIEVMGVDDPHLEYDDLPKVAGAAPDADLTMGVMHAPYQRVLNQFATDGAAMLIAGHTHGGQLCLPFYGALVTNCDLDRRRAKGLSRWWPGAGAAPSSAAPPEAAWLHVSAGLGTSPKAPVRFACRPEATLLTLTAG